MTSLVPLTGSEAYSGARIERATLEDGRVVFVKHLPPEGDWLTRATNGAGRASLLWQRGLLRRLEPAVEHGVLGIETDGDHEALVMTDLSDRLWEAAASLSETQVRAALAGLGHMHALGAEIVDRGELAGVELCAVGARYGMFAPAIHDADDGPHPHPARQQIVEGWRVFFDRVAADVAGAVAAVHADPAAFGRKFEAVDRPTTVLHGDAKPENLGVGPDRRLVAIDWGELTGTGPREVDVAWFALMSTRAARLAADPDEVFAWYEDVTGVTLDPLALDLACVGSLAQMGFRLARVAAEALNPAIRSAGAARLGWWESRVRAALDRR